MDDYRYLHLSKEDVLNRIWRFRSDRVCNIVSDLDEEGIPFKFLHPTVLKGIFYPKNTPYLNLSSRFFIYQKRRLFFFFKTKSEIGGFKHATDNDTLNFLKFLDYAQKCNIPELYEHEGVERISINEAIDLFKTK